MSERYRVRVTKDHLVFSAAHFVTIGDECERLHGHNWRVACEVSGDLDDDGFVVDFIALRDRLQEITNRLDHRMLLPTRHPAISVATNNGEVEARFADRRWIFPQNECVLLPVKQTTAEALAHWIGTETRRTLRLNLTHRLDTLRMEVEENFGQWAICELPWDEGEARSGE